MITVHGEIVFDFNNERYTIAHGGQVFHDLDELSLHLESHIRQIRHGAKNKRINEAMRASQKPCPSTRKVWS